jgi:hypothetical protein
MDPKRWTWIFTSLAVVFFVALLGRVFYLDRQVGYLPCDDKSLADNVIVPAASPATVVKFFPNKIGLGSPLCVAIAGPANVAADKDGKPTLHLFLDGLELKSAVGTPVDRKKNLVVFDVARSADDAAVWSKIIGQLNWVKAGLGVAVHVGVGTDKDGEYNYSNAETPTSLELMMVDLVSLILGALSFCFAVLALVCVAQISAILRDGGVNSKFSLARVQMAFWLYLITAAFVFIWLVTGDYNGVLTPQSLTLIGISSTTALMAISIGDGATVAPVAAPAATGAAAAIWAAFEKFLTDILSDADGVALHRLQIVVWTLILGAVFFAEIFRSFRLPTFDSNLLILMGISGVTYVGFKFQEKKD